jgi:pimeloyl-ACP methyl ester carboxylesterase
MFPMPKRPRGWQLLRPARRRTQLLILAAAATAVLASAATAAGADTGPGTTTRAATAPKPTIVLVHGAWADSNGWDTEITTLTGLGYAVVPIANPLRGLTSDSDYVRARLEQISGPIVLVGHSYGGAVITNAARGVSNVKALVYVAAFSLAEGESLATVLPADRYPGSHLDGSKLDVVPVPNAAAPGGQDVDLYIKPADFRDIFAGDVSTHEAMLEAATQRPFANTAFTQPSGPPAWASIPSWDLISLDDHAISPAGQMFMAQRMHATTAAVHSAHDIMISHPVAVDQIILRAATAVG